LWLPTETAINAWSIPIFPSPFGDQEVILFDEQTVVGPRNVNSARLELFAIPGKLAVEHLMPAQASEQGRRRIFWR
jgi:hypothetical protein